MTIFVYGSLKKGYYNHRLLTNAGLLGEFRTQPNYQLYDNGSFPYLVEVQPGEGVCVEGEVYEVTDQQLKALDRLEGHPDHYVRKAVALQEIENVEAYVYPHEVDGCTNCGTRWGK